MWAFIDFFKKLFDSSGFMPRWECGKWSEGHGWVYILSNINIGISYLGIPMIMIFFIRKRKDVPFPRVFILFSLFIIFCGLTHIVDAIMFWCPLYRLNAALLFITAIVSSCTIIVLYKVLPQAFNLKSPQQLQKIIDEQTNDLNEYNQKLKESEQQFKALVNKNPDVITLIDKNLRYKFVNDSLCSLYGRELESFIGKSPLEALPNYPNSIIFTEHIKETFKTGKPVNYEVTALYENKGQVYYAVEIIPLFDNQGQVNEVLTISKDITKTRNDEAHLKDTIHRLDKLSKRMEFKRNVLQNFAYIVSHNLRSPTGNLVALIDIYKRTTDEKKKNELIGKFFDVTVQLSNTVHNLSDVVNINQNMEMERQELLFKEILQNTMVSLSAQITATHAEITYDFSACETINYPKMYLESIILNLLTNALKYSSKERTPKVSFISNKEENGLITLECKDNGLGIDLEKYGKKVFSLHKTFHNNPDAKGIGLFITKHQIKSLGGSITVESEVDKGATFFIKFNEIEVL